MGRGTALVKDFHFETLNESKIFLQNFRGL